MRTAIMSLSVLLILTIALGSLSAVNAKVPCTITYEPLPIPVTQPAAASRSGSVVCTVQVDLTEAVCITKDKYYHRQDCKTLTSGHLYTTLEHAIAEGYKPCPVCQP